MDPVLLLFIIISICQNFHLTSAKPGEIEICIRSGSSVILAKTMTPTFQSITYCNIMLDDHPQKTTLNLSCQNGIRNYFLDNLETDGTVRTYATECKNKLGIENWKRCTDIILYLNSNHLCWDMTSATNLIIKLDKSHFLTDEQLNKIDMRARKYFRLINILNSCTGILDDKFENTVGVLHYYRKIKEGDYPDKNGSDHRVCGCDQILGIFNFYRRRKIYEYLSRSNTGNNEKQSTPPSIGLTHDILEAECEGKQTIWKRLMDNYDKKIIGDENREELHDLYTHICLENDDLSLKEHLNKSKLDVLADSVKYITFKRFKDLSVSGLKLFHSGGWLTLDKPESHWPVDYLFSKIQVNEKLDEKSVDFIANVIIWGFSTAEYDEYMSLLVNKLQVNEKECPKTILETFMVKISNEGINEKKDYWRNKENKNSFNQHLKILLDIYSKTTNRPPVGRCEWFSSLVTEIEKLFYSANWSEVHFNNLLRTGFYSELNLTTVRNCLKLSLDVEKAIEKLKSDKQNGKVTTSNWTPNDRELENFRIYLLGSKDKAESNCEPGNRIYDLNKYDDLIAVYKTVTRFSLSFKK